VAFIFAGCGSTFNSECDDAVTQRKGTVRLGMAAAVVTQSEDAYAKSKRIVVIDKNPAISGKVFARFGLTDESDLTASFLYATYPGYGFQAAYKKSLTTSFIKTAVFGSLQYFATNDEVPYWEEWKSTYNRKFSNFTFGGVSSIVDARGIRPGSEIYALFSIGAKFSVCYADVRRDVVYYPSQFYRDVPPPVTETTNALYYLATPYLVVSTRNSGGINVFAEFQWQFA
jgi:hypothetical protein